MKNVYNNKKYRENSALLKNVFSQNCYLCHSEKSKIEIHHIDKNSSNNELKNLVPLCSSCHKIVHISKIDFGNYWKDLKKALLEFLIRVVKDNF